MFHCKSNFLLGAVFAFGLGAQSSAMAQEAFEWRSLNGVPAQMSSGQTLRLNVDGWRHVKQIRLSAYGIGGEALFEVRANGETKGTVHVPSQDPDYIVTIAESVREIEFVHVSGARIQVQSVQALASTRSGDDSGHPGFFDDRDLASELSHAAIEASTKLFPFSTEAEKQTYLVPVRMAGGRAYAISQSRNDTSTRVRESLDALLLQMKFASPFIEQSLRNDAAFDAAVEFLSVKERLEAALE